MILKILRTLTTSYAGNFQKPPSYTVCMTNSSQTTLPPTYEEALEARKKMQAQAFPTRKNQRNSGIFVV